MSGILGLLTCSGEFYLILQSLIYLVQSEGFFYSLLLPQRSFNPFAFMRTFSAKSYGFNKEEFLSVLLPRIPSASVDSSTGTPLIAFLCILSLAEEMESERTSKNIQNASQQCRAQNAPVNLPLLTILLYADRPLQLQRVFSALQNEGINLNESIAVTEKLCALLLRCLKSSKKTTPENSTATKKEATPLASRIVEYFTESGLKEVTPLFLACFINDFELAELLIQNGADLKQVKISFDKLL